MDYKIGILFRSDFVEGVKSFSRCEGVCWFDDVVFEGWAENRLHIVGGKNKFCNWFCGFIIFID